MPAASIPAVPRLPDMLRRAVACVLTCLGICASASAQYVRDSLAREPVFRGTQLIAPVVLGSAGAAFHYLGHQGVEIPVREYIQGGLRKDSPFLDIGSYTQYVPVAAHLGLGLAGVPARHAFVDRCIEASISYVFCLGAGFLLKKAVAAERPGGGEFNSFPSGHAIKAFTGAELLRMDYGWAWGGGGYALAVFSGAERLWGDRHWLGDILAGAGLGILSAHVGEWLLQPFKSLFGIPDVRWDGLGGRQVQLSVMPGIDPVSGLSTAGLCMAF